MQWISLICITCFIHICSPARILGVFPIPSISHQIVFRALMEELAKRGHHIVIITPDPLGPAAPWHFQNVTEIDVHDISYKIWRERFEYGDRNTHGAHSFFSEMIHDIADAQMSTLAVKKMISEKRRSFDLVFAETMAPISFAYAAYFDAPLIGISSLSALVSNFEAVGSPTHPLLYPDIYRRYTGELNFWQKLHTMRTDLNQRYQRYLYASKYDALARKHFGKNVPSIRNTEERMDMLFINAHPLLAGVRPVVPAVVYMGSVHIRPTKPLPQDLKSLLDDSPQGVIYFSLGSNVVAEDLSMEKKRAMLDAFAEMPYTVLWKFENDTLLGKPSNVRISKWFPQQDILGHPNVKAFITQGGQQSMEEGIHKQVPFIGIPFFGDQDINVQRMVHLGIGVGLDLQAITKDSFKEAITMVAEGKGYHNTIKKLSHVLSDQPMTGLERAVWWTEYVLRHGGAQHLRAPAADVSWIEFFMLDVLATLLLLIFIVIFTILIASKLIKCLFFSFSSMRKLKKS